MKTKSKIALAATAAVTVSALAFSLPSLAHDARGGSKPMGSDRGHSSEAMSNKAELAATITGIPSSITDLHDAASGAFFRVYRLADGQTALPASQPTTGAKKIAAHPERSADGMENTAEIVSGSFEGVVHFKGTKGAGVVRYALYPSDGSAAVLVTVTTDSAGVATATASSSLGVAYDAAVAASSAADEATGSKAERHGKGHGPKDGSRAGHGKGHRR